MAERDKDRQADRDGRLQWAVIVLAMLMTLGMLAVAVRVENAGPAKPDRIRIFDNLKSID